MKLSKGQKIAIPIFAVIVIVLIAVAVQLSGRYVRKMFHESVKKTLKGGNKS